MCSELLLISRDFIFKNSKEEMKSIESNEVGYECVYLHTDKKNTLLVLKMKRYDAHLKSLHCGHI